jgi:hypothetical protein
MNQVLDSGCRRVFDTGAHRDRSIGKGNFALIPFQGLLEVAQIFEAGAEKYTGNNWRLGMPLSEYANSAIRHSVKAANGWNDENHAAMAAWNWLCFIETRRMIAEGLLPKRLDDISNWQTKDGVDDALARVREENKVKEQDGAA